MEALLKLIREEIKELNAGIIALQKGQIAITECVDVNAEVLNKRIYLTELEIQRLKLEIQRLNRKI